MVELVQLRQLAGEISIIYSSYLKKKIPQEEVKKLVNVLLKQLEDGLDKSQINIVSLFPNNQPYLHLNQTYGSFNLSLTLTPSSSGHYSVALVHPGVVIYDSKPLLESDILHYACLPIYRDKETIEECQRTTHQIKWIPGEKDYHLNAHPGDKLVFISTQPETITSCNYKREIPLNPDYDLNVSTHPIEITLESPGQYYFTSRPHRKQIFIEITVKDCPCSS